MTRVANDSAIRVSIDFGVGRGEELLDAVFASFGSITGEKVVPVPQVRLPLVESLDDGDLLLLYADGVFRNDNSDAVTSPFVEDAVEEQDEEESDKALSPIADKKPNCSPGIRPRFAPSTRL